MSETIIPVLLGADLNCYNVARAFHEAYGVSSYAFGRYAVSATKYSRLVHFTAVPELEDEAEELWEDAQSELKRGVAAVKEWLHNTLYEAGRVFREHKTAILAIAGAIAGAATVAAVLWAVLKKKD